MRNFLAKSLYYVYSEEKIVYQKFNCVYTVQYKICAKIQEFIVYTQYSRNFVQK